MKKYSGQIIGNDTTMKSVSGCRHSGLSFKGFSDSSMISVMLFDINGKDHMTIVKRTLNPKAGEPSETVLFDGKF